MLVTETLQYKRLVRQYDLGLLYRPNLPLIAHTFLSGLGSALATLANLTGTQASIFGKARELARLKRKAREALRSACAAINRIAIAVAVETPGFDDKFEMPVVGDEKLLTAGRSFAEDAAPNSAVFITHALPASFIEDLKTDVQNFEQAIKNSSDGDHACDAVMNTIDATMDQAVAAAKRLDALVRNTFRDDSTKLDEWDRASELGRSKSKPAEGETKPAAQSPPAA
jgi:hypothetical protein